MQTLTRTELTAALAARQMLLAREPLGPAEAIRRLTPLQGQDSPAPYFALAARLVGPVRDDLQAAMDSRGVVKTTIMRFTRIRDRHRIIPPEVQPLKLTLSGDATVTVDGRVAASWRQQREGDAVKLTITPHVEIRRSAREEIRAEGERTARFSELDARTFDVAGL